MTVANPRVLAASFGVAFALFPFYPAFVELTGVPVPGVALLPHAFTVALLVLVALICAYWTTMLFASPPQPMPTLLPLAAFPLAALAAAVFGFDPLAGLPFVAAFAIGLIAHAAILRFFDEPGVARALFASYLVSGALASLAAIVMVLTKTPASLYTIGHGRAVGTFVLPGELAGYLIVFVPVAYALARADRGLRIAAWAGIAIGTVAFALTFSRAGSIGMAAALATFVLLRRPGRGGRAAVLIMGAAVLAVALVFNAHHDPSENFTRLSIWDAALRTATRFPFSGVGPFEFAHLYDAMRAPGGEPTAFHAHSVLLTVAAETGLIGLVTLVFGWARFAGELRARLRTDAPFSIVAAGIAAGLVGTWVQGTVDTISIVIFGLWLPFMALALACAGDAVRAPVWSLATPRRKTAAALALGAIALGAAALQLGSDAIFANAAAPRSLPAQLPPLLGARVYGALERVAPVPYVETALAEGALRRGDVASAAAHAARLPAAPVHSEIRARLAAAQGRTDDAIRFALDAGDDRMVQGYVATLGRNGRLTDAYALESQLRDRLAAAGTRPNALADSWWRLAGLALRLGRPDEAAQDDDRAVALAPLNTKYLLAAGNLALQRGDRAKAAANFARAQEIDPAGDDRAQALTFP